jgi:ethanolamine utilization cobalamin adenosyltransferase
MTPFLASYCYHLSRGTTPTVTNVLSSCSVAYRHWMQAVVEHFKKELEKSSKQMKKYADQSRIEPPFFELRNVVMLNRENIKTRGPT